MKMAECHGDIRDPVRLGNVRVSSFQLADFIKREASSRRIPASVDTDTVSSGSLLSRKDYPCVIVSHPDHPTDYFKIVVIIGDSTVSFKYSGYSKAHHAHNRKEAYKKESSIGSLIKSAFVNDDIMAMQDEDVWRSVIIEILETQITM